MVIAIVKRRFVQIHHTPLRFFIDIGLLYPRLIADYPLDQFDAVDRYVVVTRVPV